MARTTHIRLVNGFSRVQEGRLQVRGRKDAIPPITLSCYPSYPYWPNSPLPLETTGVKAADTRRDGALVPSA
jgi:hypothetical protein